MFSGKIESLRVFRQSRMICKLREDQRKLFFLMIYEASPKSLNSQWISAAWFYLERWISSYVPLFLWEVTMRSWCSDQLSFRVGGKLFTKFSTNFDDPVVVK